MAKNKIRICACVFAVALALAAALVATSSQVSARAADDALTVTKVTTGFVYRDDSDPTTVVDFTLPPEVKGYFELVLPESVTTIESGAFEADNANSPLATRMLAVDVHGVENIMQNAFVGCQSLVEVYISADNVSGVAGAGLTDADPVGNRRRMSIVTSEAQKSLHVEKNGNDSYLFVRNGRADSTDWTLLDYDGSTAALTLPDASLCAKSLTGAAVTQTYAVGAHAFERDTLTAVTVPACVTEIGDSAFSGCGSLATLTLHEGLQTIGGSAFYGTGVIDLTVPATCTEVGIDAFHNCTSLTGLRFAPRTAELLLRHHSFTDCDALAAVVLPSDAKTVVRQYAFSGCDSLTWVYTGADTIFENVSTMTGDPNAVFFPTTNTALTVIFPDKAAYDTMKAQKEGKGNATFVTKHGNKSTYLVRVNRYIGDEQTPTTYIRLHGKAFNYVQDPETLSWAATAYATLPAQAAHYASTVYYGERDLKNAIDYAGVSAQLAAEKDVIDLYCYETIAKPVLPAEPASWVYDNGKSYDIADISQVMQALGCDTQYTQAQLSALRYNVVYADRDSKVGATPSAIKGEGAYSVTFTLDPAYGVWTSQVDGSVTVNVNTAPFNIVLVIFLLIGILAVSATVVTAVLRHKVQARNRRKQLSSKDVIEKFRAAGGETDLK